MTIHWKSLALVLTGILLGCAGNVAQSAYAEGGGESWKCLGPSMGSSGIAKDLNVLANQGHDSMLMSEIGGGGVVVCGKR